MFGRSKNGASSNVEAMAAAISRSQAVIEFRTDGTIVTANENFLRALGYALLALSFRRSRHHSLIGLACRLPSATPPRACVNP